MNAAPDPPRAAPAARRSRFVDLAPFRASAAFSRLFAGQSVAGIGGQLTLTAVGLNVYTLTGSVPATAAVGVIALVPTVLAGLYGGMVADAFDRRRVALVAAVVSWLSTLTLATLSWTGAETVWSLYGLSVLTAVATTVLSATQSAMLPRLLGTALLPAAAALNGITFGIAITLGPALAGVLVAAVGFQWCYTTDAVLFVAALTALLTLPPMPPGGPVDRPGLASLLGGFRFLRGAPNIRTGFVVDIIAMTFGQPRALLPAVGLMAFGGGAVTVGILSAAFAVGALLSSVFSGRLGTWRMQGAAIERAIQVYGVCILGFGLVLAGTAVGRTAGWVGPVSDSPIGMNVAAVALGGLALAGAGAADNVSAVFRSTMLQAAAPDGVRGRLQGVFIVVVTGGPRVGDLYLGLLAAAGALWLPPLLGGLLVIALVTVSARAARGFRTYDALHPTS